MSENKEHVVRVRIDEETKETLNKITEKTGRSTSEIIREGIKKQDNEPDSTRSYIKCRLVGFNNLVLKDNKKYIIDNGLIKSIFISDEIETMQVELADGITYTEHSQEITSYLNHICFNLIINESVDTYQPVRIVECINENNQMKVYDSIGLREEIRIIRNCNADSIYEKIVNGPTGFEKHYLLYERIFRTLHNPNLIMQFMSLYQMLMELVSKKKKHVEQRNVVEYFKDNREKYNWIYFKKTRRPDKDFEEDMFTYIRNEIGHSEETDNLDLYKEMGQQVTPWLIKHLVSVLNDIIVELK